MTWFKVDDGFPDHPKVMALEEGEYFAEAIALWTLAGAWCARHLTDGHVPRNALRRVTPFGATAAEAAAAELVRVGLWEEVTDGWRYKDWHDYQPTRNDVRQQREKTRERVRRHREAKREGNAVTPSEGNGVGNGAPDPARPDQLVNGSPDGEPCAAPASGSPPPAPGPSVGEQIRELEARYPAELMRDVREACALARKSGRMTDPPWLKVLRQLEKHPLDAVVRGCRTFVERHGDGDKREEYLLGIVRREAKGGARAGPAPAHPHRSYGDDDPDQVWGKGAEATR